MLIIDYYNFLYYRYPEINEAIVIFNLNILRSFVKNKDINIKVVFDGIYFQNINFSQKQIQLHFAYAMTADDYIINIFSHLQGRSHVLVSKDRALGSFIKQRNNATIIAPELFWKELDYILKYSNINNKKSSLIKTTDDKNSDIDLLFYNYFNKKD